MRLFAFLCAVCIEGLNSTITEAIISSRAMNLNSTPTVIGFPVHEEEKQPRTMMLPPPCFTVEVLFFYCVRLPNSCFGHLFAVCTQLCPATLRLVRKALCSEREAGYC